MKKKGNPCSKPTWLVLLAVILWMLPTTMPVSAETTLPRIIKNGIPVPTQQEQEKHQEPPISQWYHWEDVQQLKQVSPGWMTFINHSRGYQLTVPDTWEIDMSLSAVRAVLEDTDTRLEIFYDDFNRTVHSASSYIAYSRGFLDNRQDHHVEHRETLTVDGMTVDFLQWRRTPLAAVEADQPYYAKAVFVKNSREVYTLFFKSSKPLENHREIIESFRLTEISATPGLHVKYQPVERDWNETTRQFYDHYFINNEEMAWGIFESSAPRNFSPLTQLENQLNHQFRFLLLYKNLGSDFPRQELINARERGRHVVLTLQTEYLDKSLNTRSLYALLEGEHDHLLETFAQGLKDYGDPVLFRLNNEMNGDWCSYSAYWASMDTEVYLASWRYVYEYFEKAGVDNVIWVWNPHDDSFPGFAWNHYLTYYPGDDYVDLIGLTGYNPGTYFPGEPWRPFHEIYPPLYEEYMRLFQHPFIITEFGSNSHGGDKTQWIQAMFYHMPRFENIRVAIWWNGIDWDAAGNPGRIYKLDEAPEYVAAFREGLSRYTIPPLPSAPTTGQDETGDEQDGQDEADDETATEQAEATEATSE